MLPAALGIGVREILMNLRPSDPVEALLAHNLWATRLVLEKCRGLTEEEFARPFPIGPADHGGLRAILTHLVGAMRRWADRIAERAVRTALEPWRRRPGEEPDVAQPRTPDELLAILEEAHADLAGVISRARAQGVEREVHQHFQTAAGPKTFSFTIGTAIASAAVHGHYHRAQCMNIFRQLGVPGASIDVIDWEQAERGGE